MGKMKELFMEYQQQMTGSNADMLDDEYHFQKWVQERVDIDGWTEEMEARYWAEQPPHPFATDEELEQMYSASILPDEMFYDDEYYKSIYIPTIEEEEAAFKLFNKQK
jgi:hypothetical protein